MFKISCLILVFLMSGFVFAGDYQKECNKVRSIVLNEGIRIEMTLVATDLLDAENLISDKIVVSFLPLPSNVNECYYNGEYFLIKPGPGVLATENNDKFYVYLNDNNLLSTDNGVNWFSEERFTLDTSPLVIATLLKSRGWSAFESNSSLIVNLLKYEAYQLDYKMHIIPVSLTRKLNIQHRLGQGYRDGRVYNLTIKDVRFYIEL